MTALVRRQIVAGLCVLPLTLVAACDQTSPGTPSPQTSAPTTTDSTAPKVSNPKNLKARQACQLLTQDQVQRLGATSTTKVKKSPWGEDQCQWINDAISLYISPDTTQGKGLSTVYDNMAGGENFAPLTIAGYPAARTDKQSLSCAIYVATSDTQDFLVDFTRLGGTRADYMDPCGFAQTVATDVLNNLPAGQ